MKLENNIRFASREDAELLAKLGRETFYDAFAMHPLMPRTDLELYLKAAFSVSRIAGELDEPRSAFLLAEIDGQAVGYAKLGADERKPELLAENPVKLKRLYARREFIGRGIGASLLFRCLDEAGRRGHDAIWLHVWRHNRRAQDFYRKWGFERCGTFDFQFGNTTLTDILMQRFL